MKQHTTIKHTDPENEHDTEDFEDAQKNFEQFTENLEQKLENRKKRQREHESDTLFEKEIQRIQQLLEADKVVSLHSNGHFHLETAKENLVTEHHKNPVEIRTVKGFSIASVRVYEDKVSIQYRP